MADTNLIYPYEFKGGQKAVASEVNANFEAVKAFANGINSTISAINSAVTDLKNKPTREMMDVYFSFSGEAPVGAYPLWTGETITNCKSLYPDFWRKLNQLANSGKVPTVDNAGYNDKLAKYGQCASFYIDTLNGSVRLPKITRFISSITALNELAKEENAGLPDHNHTYTADGWRGKDGRNAQAVWCSGDVRGATNVKATFSNASASNPIYGASDTVQPPAVHLCLYLQVANNTAEISALDINVITNQLNAAIEQLTAMRDTYVKELNALYNQIKNDLANATPVYKEAEVTVAVSDWAADATYPDYPYKADISESRSSENNVPQVTFSPEDAASGNYASVAQAFNGYVRIWAKEIPAAELVIQSLVLL